LKNKRAKTEIIVILDGQWADPPLVQYPDVNIIYVPESIGQRAATNLGVKLSKSHWVMKLDAHCSWDEGYDAKMIQGFKEMGDNTTMVGIMRNLWMFDWKCYHCGWKKYQGPTPLKCEQCGKTDKIRKKMIILGKERPQSVSYCFDSEPHFQYFNEYTKRPEYQEQLKTGFTETMSLQGSCFMITRENYWKWEVCDEKAGSWGNQGLEVACATWLNGGRVLVNRKTWYAHMFRTQGGDFSFPYKQSGRQVQQTKNYIKEKYWKNPKLKDLIKKFWPVVGWTEEDLKKIK